MMNPIGIDIAPDWKRIRHLFKIGIFAALLVLIGDMLLGWVAADESLTGIEGYFSRYLTVSDVRIFFLSKSTIRFLLQNIKVIHSLLLRFDLSRIQRILHYIIADGIFCKEI